MPPGIPVTPLAIAALVVGALGALFLLGAIIALFRARALGFAMRLLAATALLALGALFGAIAIGTQGYRALTREDLAARIVVQPTGAQRFSATVRFADGREASYELAGDEIYVDAQYGSATFVPVTERAELEVRVSTTGLLMRDIGAAK